MNISTKKHLTRRAFLRGSGALLTLPWLDAMLPAFATREQAAAATNAPRRFIAVNHGLGFYPENFFPKQFGANYEPSPYHRFLGLMRSTKEGSGTLLDQTSVLISSNLGNANAHGWRDLPVIVVGGGFKHGQHLQAGGAGVANARLCNLLVQIAQQMGVETEAFSQSNGTSVKGFEAT